MTRATSSLAGPRDAGGPARVNHPGLRTGRLCYPETPQDAVGFTRRSVSEVDVSIAIVAYNALDKLRDCLDSIAAQATARTVETILVDNASTEPVAATVAAEYPWVRLIASPTNLGFAGGTNRALAAATGRFLWWLNPDTVLRDPRTLDRLVDRLEAEQPIGLLGCRLERPDGTEQVVSPRLPSVWRDVLDLCHVRLAPPDGPVEFITGASLLTRREVFNSVGPLDEGYFLYFEDADWCRRARDQGYRAAVARDVSIVHHEGASAGERQIERREHYYRGLLRYARRHEGAASVAALRLALAGTGAVKWAVALIGERSSERSARLHLFATQVALGVRGR